MGAACCVAAKDRTITSASPVEPLQRHIRYSPTLSFRWDNRVRVAEEETAAYLLRVRGCGNERMESKPGNNQTETAFVSGKEGPLSSSQSCEWRKAAVSEANSGSMKISSHDKASPQAITEVKVSAGSSPSISNPSPIKLSASPPSPQSHLLPHNSTPPRLPQASGTQIQGYKSSPKSSISQENSSSSRTSWANEASGTNVNSPSEMWSIPGFHELMNARKQSWSLGSESSSFSREILTRSSRQDSRSLSLSLDLRSCGTCTKILTEYDVVSVLACGHVYHDACLEFVTPEISKYDPPCPVCAFGEKKVAKMSAKSLKSEMNAKARKKYKKCISSSDLSSVYYRRGGIDGKGPQLSSSLSMKSSGGGSLGKKPILRRHFSFGAKSGNNKAPYENRASRNNVLLSCYKKS